VPIRKREDQADKAAALIDNMAQIGRLLTTLPLANIDPAIWHRGGQQPVLRFALVAQQPSPVPWCAGSGFG
jgi:hypothetical protein